MTKVPFTMVVEKEVIRLGEATVATLLASVGSLISASQAAVAGRRKWKADHSRGHNASPKPSAAYIVDLGRKTIMKETLHQLYSTGKIRRVRKGVYAPPQPKLFTPPEQKVG